MVVRDAADGVEAAEVVFVGVVGAVPGDDVEGCVGLRGGEEMTIKFGEEGVGSAAGVVFGEGGDGCLEVARVGETIRADGAKLGELEVSLVELEYITSDRSVG